MPSIFALSPPLLAMNAHHIESPLSNRSIDYERDTKFFAEYPYRNALIREAGFHEFDQLELSPGEWLQVPKLWVLVTQLSPGVLSNVPVYRGKKFWTFIKDDAALGLVLVEMARREGIDAAEFREFERKVIAKNSKVLTELAAKGTIH